MSSGEAESTAAYCTVAAKVNTVSEMAEALVIKTSTVRGYKYQSLGDYDLLFYGTPLSSFSDQCSWLFCDFIRTDFLLPPSNWLIPTAHPHWP